MPKSEVYQLRLTGKEKEVLALKAKGRGLSIASMIRRDYGLDGAAVIEAARSYIDSQGQPTSTDAESIAAARQFEVLVTQLKGQGMTTPVATREAKRRLGL